MAVLKAVSATKDNRVVYFAQGKSELDYQLSDNFEFLDEMNQRLYDIISDSRNRLISIEITGYASPEGGTQRNMQLSCDRAYSVKNYLQNNIPDLPDSLFTLNCQGENWSGLLSMVLASDMQYKDEVLEILANTTLDDAGVVRKNTLRNLRNGVPYDFMLNYFYPQLRNAQDIVITYRATENKNTALPNNKHAQR